MFSLAMVVRLILAIIVSTAAGTIAADKVGEKLQQRHKASYDAWCASRVRPAHKSATIVAFREVA